MTAQTTHFLVALHSGSKAAERRKQCFPIKLTKTKQRKDNNKAVVHKLVFQYHLFNSHISAASRPRKEF